MSQNIFAYSFVSGHSKQFFFYILRRKQFHFLAAGGQPPPTPLADASAKNAKFVLGAPLAS